MSPSPARFPGPGTRLEPHAGGPPGSRLPRGLPSLCRGLSTPLILFATLGFTGCGDGSGSASGAEADSVAAARAAAARLAVLAQPRRLTETAPETFSARFRTTAGDFVIEAHRSWAPRGVDRFYNAVKAGYYDSVYVHRVVPGQVAQFGIHPDPRINAVWERSVIADDPPGESNTRGRVSFANSGPNSRSAQLFINLEDNEGFDSRGFVPIGEVVEGMDVVDSFYDEYGDGPPRGEGPYQAQAAASGNAYFRENFPLLTQILEARVEVGPGG